MGTRKSRKLALSFFIAIGIIGLVMIYLMVGPPKLLAASSKPTFCAKCHVMESEYTAWQHTGAHRRIDCVDCHLPNHNTAVHYTWKTIDGLKDVLVFYSGSVPERIDITPHGKEVLQTNCIRCHETTVMFMDTSRQCWDCHKRIMHRKSGTIMTF